MTIVPTSDHPARQRPHARPEHPPPGDDPPDAYAEHHVAVRRPPVVLFTTDLGLTHRVEDLGDDVGVDVLTFAAPTLDLAPSPPLVLVGHDVVGDLLHLLRDHPSPTPTESPDGGMVVVGGRAAGASVWERAAHLGAETVVFIPGDETWLVSRMLTATMGPIPVGAHVIGVMGGRGGAGASVLAAALARTAARNRLRVVLIDADPLGGGIDLTLGAEDASGFRWPDLEPARGVLDTDELAGYLPVIDGVRVITWDRTRAAPVPPDAMRAVVDATVRMSDLVVIDLPRSLDQAATLALQACRTVLLVVSADIQATVAARRSAAVLRRWADDVRLVVRGPAPGRLDASAVAKALDLPLAGWVDREPRLAAGLERGEPPALRRRGPMAAFCRDVLAEITPAQPRPGRRSRGLR
jgi:secretion/DNA translocation related CpaE-like protein